MGIISVKDLHKSYGDFKAVNGISFEVKTGSIFGLLGPNGAGKTTTLEIIETLKSKDSGTVLVDGMNIDTHATEIKQIIGVQLQAAGYFPNLNLKELVELFAGLYNVTVDPYEVLDSVQLKDKAKNQFKQLSGGQKQRFSIATTIIHNPKIVFLDEPTTGLDPQARRNLWDQILALKAMGTTVVLTTHYMDEAEVLCDEIAIVDSGKILTIDTPTNMIDKLIASGYQSQKTQKAATLEDVFINLTGKTLRN